MKKKINLFGLFVVTFTLLISCNNYEQFPMEENYKFGVKLNLNNYTEQEFPKGTIIYLIAIDHDTCFAVDSIKTNTIITSKNSNKNADYSETQIPMDIDSGFIFDIKLWKINLEAVKNRSNNGAILIRFPSHGTELIDHQFSFDNSNFNIPLDMKLTHNEIGQIYYSIESNIYNSNLTLIKNSNLVFKQVLK